MDETLISVEEAKQQEVSEEFIANLDDTVAKIANGSEWVQAQALATSEQEFEKAIKTEGLTSDDQTQQFSKFLSVATNFASSAFSERLNGVPKVIQTISDLLNQMREEVKEYADIANQFEELIQIFNKLVSETEHKMGLMLPHLSGAKDHLSVLSEVFESKDKTFNVNDQNDIKVAMEGLVKGMKQMKDLSRSSGQESHKLVEHITALKTKVHKQRGTVQGRIHLSKVLSWLGPLAGSSIVARVVATLLSVQEFGGAGVLVIGGLSLNPIAAIVCGALLGGTLIISIAGLVYRFWTRHQYRALHFLEKISAGLMELSKSNTFFLDYLNKSEEAAHSISTQLEQIQSSLTSERYRKHNAKLCKKALETVEEAVEVVEKIRNIDMAGWQVPQKPQLVVIHKLVLAVRAPQEL